MQVRYLYLVLGFLVKGADNRTLRLFWCICGAYYVGIYAECNCAEA